MGKKRVRVHFETFSFYARFLLGEESRGRNGGGKKGRKKEKKRLGVENGKKKDKDQVESKK